MAVNIFDFTTLNKLCSNQSDVHKVFFNKSYKKCCNIYNNILTFLIIRI